MSVKSELQVPQGAYRIHRWAAVILLVVWVWIFSLHAATLTIYELLLLLIFGAVGFLPTFVAGMRRHGNGIAIFVLNLLLFCVLALTWQFRDLIGDFIFRAAQLLEAVGWIIAVVWSFTSKRLD
jgi:hypothetical protein